MYRRCAVVSFGCCDFWDKLLLERVVMAFRRSEEKDMEELIKAVLFDFGGVFTDSPFRVSEAVGDQMGVEREQMMGIVFGPYHRDTAHPWHKLERGEISFEQAREEITALGSAAGVEIDLLRVLGAIGSSNSTRDAMVSRAQGLRDAGLKTALLTNNAREFSSVWRPMLPLDRLFDVVVDSSEVGMRKPDARIYLHTLELLGVAAENSMFLDDFEANVEAARNLGIHGVLVEPDPSAALAELDRVLDSYRRV